MGSAICQRDRKKRWPLEFDREAMLADALPQEYEGYANRTWRLIPFIY